MFPDRLRFLRQEAGYTQQRVGDQLGVSQQTIAQWEKGNREPDHKMLKRIAGLFNVSIDYLIGSDQPMDSQIAENIKRCRERLDVSQSTLAEHLGVNEKRIADLESGKALPSMAEIERISKMLWSSPEELLSMQHLFDESFIREKFLSTVLGKFGFTCLKESSPESRYMIFNGENFYYFTDEQFLGFVESIDDYIGFSMHQLLKKAVEVVYIDHRKYDANASEDSSKES